MPVWGDMNSQSCNCPIVWIDAVFAVSGKTKPRDAAVGMRFDGSRPQPGWDSLMAAVCGKRSRTPPLGLPGGRAMTAC